MGCLKPLGQCIARGASGGRQKARERTVNLLHLLRAADFFFTHATSFRFCEREAAVEIAAHRPKLSMGCLKPVEEYSICSAACGSE